MNNKVKFLIGMGLIIALISAMGLSYAYWKYTDTQDISNVVGTKCLKLTMQNETDGITIPDAIPKSDERGKDQEGYTFIVKNTCNTIAYYQVNLEEIEEAKRLEDNYIKVSLNGSDGKLLSSYKGADPTIKETDFTSDKSHNLTSDSLKPNEEKRYTLKLWMDEKTPASKDTMHATFESKVSIIAVSKEEEELENTIVADYTEPNEYSSESEEITIHATSETYNLIEYAINNEAWNSIEKTGKDVTIKETFTKEGEYKVSVRDEVGNIGETSVETKMLDKTSPEISIEETSDENGAVLTITFQDAKSGLQAYKIEDDISAVDLEDGWTEFTDEHTQIIEYHSDINKKIHITVKDKLENIKDEEYTITKVDFDGPMITLTNDLKETWGTKDTIHISATDDISGVKEIEIQKDGTQVYTNILEEPTKEYKYDYDVEENGTYKVIIKDALGNTSEDTSIDIQYIDEVNPSITSVTNSAGDSWTNEEVTITINVTEQESGIQKCEYKIGIEDYKDANGTIKEETYTFNYDVAQNNEVMTVKCYDNVGNEGNESNVTIKIDKANPTIENVTLARSDTTLIATAVTQDTGGSGIKETGGYAFVYTENGIKKPTVYSDTNIYNKFVGTRGSTYTATVTASDNAGNVSEEKSSESVKIPLIVNLSGKNIEIVESGNGLYSVPHSGVTGTTNDTEFQKTEYRYAGQNPDNYVTFNNEVAGWRIIGLVNTPNGQRIKLIKKDYYNTSIAWDSNKINNWETSTLQTTLNTTYYNTLQTAQNMIDANVTWNLGGTKSYQSSSDGLVTHWYSYERGTTVYKNRPTTWTGKIGLMYPSDYGYATSGESTTDRTNCLAIELYHWNNSSVSDCKNNDWLYDSSNYQWTLTPRSSTSTGVYELYSRGYLQSSNADDSDAVRPVVYLKPEVKITGGSGLSSSPYTLSL